MHACASPVTFRIRPVLSQPLGKVRTVRVQPPRLHPHTGSAELRCDHSASVPKVYLGTGLSCHNAQLCTQLQLHHQKGHKLKHDLGDQSSNASSKLSSERCWNVCFFNLLARKQRSRHAKAFPSTEEERKDLKNGSSKSKDVSKRLKRSAIPTTPKASGR